MELAHIVDKHRVLFYFYFTVEKSKTNKMQYIFF